MEIKDISSTSWRKNIFGDFLILFVFCRKKNAVYRQKCTPIWPSKSKHSKSEAIFMFCVVIDLCKKLYFLEWLRSNMESSIGRWNGICCGKLFRKNCSKDTYDRTVVSAGYVEPTVCIMFDLNNLKTANDTMGHSAGDRLIMDFAWLLRSVIPDKGFVGEYGGDEFMAVFSRK